MGHKPLAGSDRHHPPHNVRTHFTILRKNQPARQQETTKERRLNSQHTLPHNRSHQNLRHHSINVNVSTSIPRCPQLGQDTLTSSKRLGYGKSEERQLLKRNMSTDELDQHILQIVKEKNPETVEQLIRLMQKEVRLSQQEILDRILYLQEKEKIQLKPYHGRTPESLTAYLGSVQASWYWITIIITLVTTLLVFSTPENVVPLVYARYLLGSVFVLWLPGYAFIKALFPTRVPIQTRSKDLDTIERVALSFGMSIALVPIIGLLLNYTPWGIRLTPITLSLSALTLTFATAAIIREHQTKRQP